ncbi:HxlR family transcriptional regulator [Bacillaceae bacterium JMAK1]|nr:HxlR family transcriptional regulator [Bacillaceae bacterium JMAK1]
MKERYPLPCNIAQTLNIVGDRWTLLIIHEILVGNTTFNDIKHNLETISANLLSTRLKALEQQGMIVSELYSKHPPRYQYALTKKSKDLEPVFHALLLWGREHLDTCYKALVNSDTGNDVEIGYYDQKTGERIPQEHLSVIPYEHQT